MPKTKASNCVACGKKLDAACCMDKSNRKPGLGDITMCFYCGEIMVFSDKMKLKAVNLLDIEKIDAKLFQTVMKMKAWRYKANSHTNVL